MTQRDTSTVEPAEPSSSMVALRTIVMIAFLVAIPLMAVFGTGLPTSLRSAMQGGSAESHFAPAVERQTDPVPSATSLAESSSTTEHRLAPADRAATVRPASESSEGHQAADEPGRALQADASSPFSDRAPRATITGVRTLAASPRARITQVRTLHETEGLRAPTPTAPLWAPGPRTAASPRVGNTTAHFEASDLRHRLAPPRENPSSAPNRSASDGSWQATAYSQRAKAAAPAPGNEESAVDANDPFARGERRLRQYGATHYRLESWGDGGELFRCSANVALPNHRYGARHFEATAASPSQAIDRLLEKVEAWRAAQR
ncbi:MAG TPA: hypothetical protein VMV10_04365 [Pirellulales bacterium]|nr:hypothetical protein [Pirellulales bacterium]